MENNKINSISIGMTIRNRANLFKYNLESISRQTCDIPIEICVLDRGSTDSLMSLIDRYSEIFTFRFALFDRNKTYLRCMNPAAGLNVLIKYLPTNNYMIKTDPEVVFKDDWIVSEIISGLEKDDTRMYNSRCHFTDSANWWDSYEDIIREHERHYHYAESGSSPFSRSKYYFLSGFSRQRFMDIGGIEELMCFGRGYDDDMLRSAWYNRYGSYEKEITGNSIHLFHEHSNVRTTKDIVNRRIFDKLKTQTENNKVRLKGGVLVRDENTLWGNPECLSKIYTIKSGTIVDIEDINNGNSQELDLPF